MAAQPRRIRRISEPVEANAKVATSDPQEVERAKCQVSKMSPPVANPKPSFLVRLVEKAPDVTRSVGVIALGLEWSVTVLVFSCVLG